MVDWNSPAEIAKDALAFDRFMHALLGVYVWEWIISLGFDWQFITGKKTFRWPMVFYFLNRYSLLFALIGIAIALNVTTEIDCQALYTFNQVFGNASIGFASINLSLRTIAVWSRKWYILFPLIAIILGHWSLLLHGILLKAAWVPGQGCVITNTDNKLLAVTFIYSMVFDFIVMVLSAIKLASPTSRNRSRLVQLIFQDGLIYFILAFLSNVVATTFMLLNLNAVMSIISNVPAAIVSTIVACRIVRRLSNFTSYGPEMFPSSTQGSTLAFRSHISGVRPKISTKGAPKEGVHVQMETYQSPALEKAAFPEYDTPSPLIKSNTSDSEAQVEFKSPPY